MRYILIINAPGVYSFDNETRELIRKGDLPGILGKDSNAIIIADDVHPEEDKISGHILTKKVADQFGY